MVHPLSNECFRSSCHEYTIFLLSFFSGVMMIINKALFQEDNIFGTYMYASLTKGPKFTKVHMLLTYNKTVIIYSMYRVGEVSATSELLKPDVRLIRAKYKLVVTLL